MQEAYRRAAAALLLVALLIGLGLPLPVRATTTLLYAGSAAGETPDDQGFFRYQAYTFTPPIVAQARYDNGGTTLRTLDAPGEYVGYVTIPGVLPVLSRSAGYTLTLTAQVLSETHQLDDRAGFSLIVLGDDRWGVELAFWRDEIWAQNDGLNDPMPGGGLFTHGEGVAFDTTTEPVTYAVAVNDDGYRLLADGVEVLAGPLRQYNPPVGGGTNPLRRFYSFGDLIFVGDNTSLAGAEVRLLRLTLEMAPGPPEPPTPTGEPIKPPPEPTATPVPVAALAPRAFLPAVRR